MDVSKKHMLINKKRSLKSLKNEKKMIIERFNASLLPQEIPEIGLTQPTPAKKVLKRPEIKIEDFPKDLQKVVTQSLFGY